MMIKGSRTSRSTLIGMLLPIAFSHAQGQTLAEAEKELEVFCADYDLNELRDVLLPFQRIVEVCERRNRFGAYQPNYMVFQKTEDDEESLEGHYSLRYLFTPPDCISAYETRKARSETEAESIEWANVALDCLKTFNRRYETYFSFTGEFDFYVGSRDSSPVVNRLLNPALHYREYKGRNLWNGPVRWEWIDYGIEHRSNGQTLELKTPEQLMAAQTAYEANTTEFFDAISHSSNYLSIESRFQINSPPDSSEKKCYKESDCFDLWLQLKPFYKRVETEVSWGPLANTGVEVSDYDRVRIILSNTFSTGFSRLRSIEITGEWTIGDKGLDTDSFDLSMRFPFDFGTRYRVPFYVRFHTGPMSTLANYTRSEKSIGIGLNFFN